MQDANRIMIVAPSLKESQGIRQHLGLRDFDQILCHTYTEAANLLKNEWVDLVLLDLGRKNEQTPNALKLLGQLNDGAGAIALADRFEEETFFNLYDAGARDYLIKPIPGPYLVSRLLNALDSLRYHQQARQWETLLTGLGVLTPLTRAYSKAYFEKLLQLELEKMVSMPTEKPPFSLITIHVAPKEAEELEPGPQVDPLRGANLEMLMGKVFRSGLRSKDMVGQWDNQTYTLLLPQTNPEGAEKALNRLLDSIQKLEQGPLQEQLKVAVKTVKPSASFTDEMNAEAMLRELQTQLKPVELPSNQK